MKSARGVRFREMHTAFLMLKESHNEHQEHFDPDRYTDHQLLHTNSETASDRNRTGEREAGVSTLAPIANARGLK